jgi:hypothetical protein
VNLDALRQRVWKTLPGFALGFLLGCFVCVSTSTYADKGSDLELRNVELDVNRNTEKIAQLQREVGSIFEWIAASDRQKIKDAEIEGEAHAKIEAHEKVIWLVLANLMGMLFLIGEFVVRKRRNGQKYDIIKE